MKKVIIEITSFNYLEESEICDSIGEMLRDAQMYEDTVIQDYSINIPEPGGELLDLNEEN